MNTMKNYIIKWQTGFFFKQPINRPDLISKSLLNKFSEFDAPPISLPIPLDAPVEIPRAELRTNNGKFGVVISRIRIDIFLNPKNIESFKDIDNKDKKFIEDLIKFSANEVIEQQVDINRIVNFSQYILRDIEESATNLIKDKFLSKDLNNLIELNIRFNEKIKIDKFDLNNITIIENGREKQSEGKDDQDIILITKDINNIIPNNNKFTVEDINLFFQKTNKLIEWGSIQALFN